MHCSGLERRECTFQGALLVPADSDAIGLRSMHVDKGAVP